MWKSRFRHGMPARGSRLRSQRIEIHGDEGTEPAGMDMNPAFIPVGSPEKFLPLLLRPDPPHVDTSRIDPELEENHFLRKLPSVLPLPLGEHAGILPEPSHRGLESSKQFLRRGKGVPVTEHTLVTERGKRGQTEQTDRDKKRRKTSSNPDSSTQEHVSPPSSPFPVQESAQGLPACIFFFFILPFSRSTECLCGEETRMRVGPVAAISPRGLPLGEGMP